MSIRSYTLHLPRHAVPGEPAAIERATIVRDGFVWPAFLFTVFWFLWHRLWLAALLVVVALAALVGAGVALNLRPGYAALASLLFSALLGLEASSLRRWTYARAGRPAADVVSAGSLAEAEQKFVARLAAGIAAPVPSALGRQPFSSAPVIGLFPEAERTR
jgi:hypothetical protein